MSSGYVLDFKDRSFREFVSENAGVDIFDEKYNYHSGSKANRLRAFWTKESDSLVSRLMRAMLDYLQSSRELSCVHWDGTVQNLFNECSRIIENLDDEGTGEHLEVIKLASNDKELALLFESIEKEILDKKPECALDRLHTFLVRYVRQLCSKHGIDYKNKPLQACFAEYIKRLKEKEIIQSRMAELILKSSISLVDAFNDVRNNQSFAHDNSVLGYDESLLIFKNVTSIIKYISSVEKAVT